MQGITGSLNPGQEEQLGIVKQSARHLLHLINDILDISKIEAGQLEIAPARFDARDSILKVLESLKPMAEEKGLDLQVELASDVGVINSDPKRFEQVLINLLNNAIKFTDKGKVCLQAQLVEKRLVVRVVETGIGIRVDDLAKLFQPFQQVDVGSTRQHEGTGLGLTISRRLAVLMGGDIHVESQRGNGSIFTLVLPLNNQDYTEEQLLPEN